MTICRYRASLAMRSQGDLTPSDTHRLWSLWDMLENFAHRHLDLGMAIHDARTVLMILDSGAAHGTRRKRTTEEAAHLSEILQRMGGLCKELGLTTSGDLIALVVDDLPETEREFDVLIQAIRSELKHKQFMFVPPHRAKYY